MRNSGQIAGKVRSVSDRAAGAVLAMLGEQDGGLSRRRHLLGTVMASTAMAGLALPAFFSGLMDLSLALPVGVGCAAALGLLAGGLVLTATEAGQADIRLRPASPHAAYDHLPGLLVRLDPQGQVLSAHGRDGEGLAGLVGLRQGLALTDAIHVSDRIEWLAALDCLRQGDEQARVSLRVPRDASLARDDGQFTLVGVRLSAIRNDDGQIESLLADLANETPLADLRADRSRLEAGVESAHATKSRFLAAVSHELRTPLNAILGFSDMLRGGYAGTLGNERQVEYVGLIHDSGQHLLDVVNSMLAMSKIEAGRYELFKEPFEIAPVLRAIEEMLGLQAREKGVVLTARSPRGLGEMLADRRAVSQILINLVGNAIKFTDKGGVVSLDCSRQGDQIVMTVSDTGIGIPADKLDQIGQPFVQIQNELTRHYEGTGLGLSLVKGLVGLHGGTFSVASKQGEGTIVTVSLPADGDAGEWAQIEEFPPRLPADKGAMHAPMEVGHGRPAAKTA